jgi:hypothetical protein
MSTLAPSPMNSSGSWKRQSEPFDGPSGHTLIERLYARPDGRSPPSHFDRRPIVLVLAANQDDDRRQMVRMLPPRLVQPPERVGLPARSEGYRWAALYEPALLGGRRMQSDTPERTDMPDNDSDTRLRELETAQATQAATMAGAQATQSAAMAGMESTNAAAQAGTMSTVTAMQAGNMAAMVAGAVGFITGMFLGIVLSNTRR